MKTINYMAAYQSPKAEMLVISSEGVLCGSLGVTHDGFSEGGSISFGGVIGEDDEF